MECVCVYPEDCTIGCAERVAIEALAGRRYIIRAYSWSDPFPLSGRYRFR